MKWLLFVIAVFLGILPARVMAQTKSLEYRSPDGVFKFNYSSTLIPCQKDPKQPDELWIPNSCNSFIPICAARSAESTDTIACMAYPIEKLKGTSFEGAAFAVSRLKDAGTEKSCATFTEPPPHYKVDKKVINGIEFQTTEDDGVATGHLVDGHVYRAFHRGACYELDLRVAFWNYDPAEDRTVKQFDIKKVFKELEPALESFTFLK